MSRSVSGTAAGAGELAVALLMRWLDRPGAALWAGFVLTFGLPTLAILLDWQLPHLA